jgi:hypothetical protein
MYRLLLLTGTALMILTGCFICEEGAGPWVTEKRNHYDFKSIDINIPATVTVRQDKKFFVSISAEKNLQERIRTRVRGKRLFIESRGCFKPGREIEVEIRLPQLQQLHLSGSATVLIPDTFHVKNIDLKVNGTGDMDLKLKAAIITTIINGSGDMVLQGTANEHRIRINGSGDVDAMDLPCQHSTVKVNGSGNVKTKTYSQLDVTINGSGSVYYREKPKLISRINGTGKVVDDN